MDVGALGLTHEEPSVFGGHDGKHCIPHGLSSTNHDSIVIYQDKWHAIMETKENRRPASLGRVPSLPSTFRVLQERDCNLKL